MKPKALYAVPGYEGLYSVTEEGQVYAWPKKSRLVGRWLKQSTDRYGYMYVCLFKDGKRKNIKVHRLVMESIYPRMEKKHVNHVDGNKKNNHLINLEWCTPKENKIHAFATGITKMQPSQIEASRRNITMYNLSKGVGRVQHNSI